MQETLSKLVAEVLALLGDERQDDFDTVLVAVRRDGAAIQYASYELQENEVIVMEAMKSNGYGLRVSRKAGHQKKKGA